MSAEEVCNNDEEVDHHDPHFEPIISLTEVKVPTMEEEEQILLQLRGKLFRLDLKEREWKERGTGEVKLLHYEKKNTVRIVMRREKTLKLCANHYITPDMELKRNCGSDRAWVWTTNADFADGEAHEEILAIKFLNSEMAGRWKCKFEEAKKIINKNGGREPTEEDRSSSEEDSEDSENSQDNSSLPEREQISKDIERLQITPNKTNDVNGS